MEFPDGLTVEVSTGVVSPMPAAVRNISRGGVLLSLDARPADVTGVGHCVLRFLDRHQRVCPSVTRGTIRRSGFEGSTVHVAIEFAQPLESLAPRADNNPVG